MNEGVVHGVPPLQSRDRAAAEFVFVARVEA